VSQIILMTTDHIRKDEEGPPSSLRVASLLPSATDMLVALSLSDYVVGVTHECNLSSVLRNRTASSEEEIRILTRSVLDPNASQGEIDSIVKQASDTCAAKAHDDVLVVNSLYPIEKEALVESKPTLVLTQDLCRVCAPSATDVSDAFAFAGPDSKNATSNIPVISLHPTSLATVAETFVTVGAACHVPERGRALKDQFLADFELLRRTVKDACASLNTEVLRSKPKLLVLEWLDPPYDAGHWIPELVEVAGCECVSMSVSVSGVSHDESGGNKKSQTMTWDQVHEADPDIVLVACCGFDLERNVRDARQAVASQNCLGTLRAARNGRVYACDGNRYFASPGPLLVGGAAIVASCAYSTMEYAHVHNAIQQLEFSPLEGQGWCKVDCCTKVPDIEDLEPKGKDFSVVHEEACAAGQMTYADPETGYFVFTELSHKKRGKCCGSGCRHCPFNHENVKDKAKHIKQPAFLYDPSSDCKEAKHVFGSNSDNDNNAPKIKVLFFSGGKDSFLTIRALVKQEQQKEASEEKMTLVLLTTFDATSRIIAHQEAHIDIVVQQARHLQIPLVGIPVHRASSESYVTRISRALRLIEAHNNNNNRSIHSLVFGDLHLEHIRGWRDSELGKLNYQLEYPLWKVPYPILMKDLEASTVPCILSAAPNDNHKDVVKVGDTFGRDYARKVEAAGLDSFGENGEFHTVAQVWKVSREQALGLPE